MLRFSRRTMRGGNAVMLIAATGTLLAATGCGSGSTAPKTGPGSLTVTITAPTGVTPNVTVSGPGGYTKALTATTTLRGLTAGSYTVSAASVTTTNAIVGTVNTATVSGSPATVIAGGTAATAAATYTPRPGSGGLWITTSNNSVVEYTAAQLASTTSAAAATAIGARATDAAFDANGNLWVALFSKNSVVEYTASQLNASGNPTPIVSISIGSNTGPYGLAFDANGNLWVANYSANTVVEYTAGQLASSGSPTPKVTISASSGSLQLPGGIAFDARGNLWIANYAASDLVEFTLSQLVASGAPTPTVTLSATSSSIAQPTLIAFDAAGTLWVPNSTSSTVVGFSASQLATTGSPTPIVTLSASAGSLSGPAGLAVDASGNLWVSASFSSVVEFTAGQIVTSGTPTPSVTVSGSSLGGPIGLAFDPHAAGLPLKP